MIFLVVFLFLSFSPGVFFLRKKKSGASGTLGTSSTAACGSSWSSGGAWLVNCVLLFLVSLIGWFWLVFGWFFCCCFFCEKSRGVSLIEFLN